MEGISWGYGSFYSIVFKAIWRIKRFVVLMYERTSELLGADAARRYLFSKKSRRSETSSNSSGFIRAHEDSRLQCRPYLGSVPRPLSMCSFTRRLGLKDVWWTMRGCLDYAPRGSQGLLRVESARRPARETTSVTGRTFSALHSALAMNSVMRIEL